MTDVTDVPLPLGWVRIPLKAKMDMTHRDALDLLRKWFHERRLIHCVIKFPEGNAKVLGRIDTVTDGSIIVSAKESKIALGLGEAYSAEIPLRADSSCEYIEGRHAPEPAREKMQAYDSMLSIYARDGILFGLAVMPPLEEFRDLEQS